MAKFNVGDIAIGNSNNFYKVTNQETLLEVTEVQDTTFSAKIIASKTTANKKQIGQVKEELEYQYFELATQGQIDAINGIKGVGEKAKKIKLGGGLEIDYYSKGIESNFNEAREMQVESDNARIEAFRKIEGLYDKTKKSIYDFKNDVDLDIFGIFSIEARNNITTNLINFFKEFDYTPSARFFDTILRKLQNTDGVKDTKTYIENYFKVSNNVNSKSICEKIKSPEFNAILNNLSIHCPGKEAVNQRLKVYFGPAGCGKTTQALKETDNRCIVCNAGMLPSDLIEDFNFKDGKPGFQKSVLRDCMENGLKVCFDEMNLLNMDTKRFMQGLLDNKTEFTYKGETIKVKPGFEVIGTMNLVVNGITNALPDPLVDRCSDISEFILDADSLWRAVL